MRKRLLFVWLIPLLLSPGCSKSPSRDLPPTLMWDKDQDLIHPSDGTMNVWEGFTVTDDHFAADRNIAQFILWRRQQGKVDIFFEYSLQGNPVEFTVNFKQRKAIPPSREFKRGQFAFHLNSGFNFLKFTKKNKDILKIRAVSIGAWREEPQPHLQAGQSFRCYYPAGKGRLELSGRGTVEIVREQAAGETLIAKSEELQSGFLSREISRTLEFSSPGLLTVKAKKGSFDISAYSYVPTIARETNVNVAFKTKPNIYMVLGDACQASHLGTYGYQRNTSPNVDAFARDAVVYENAYANAAYTFASVSTSANKPSPVRLRSARFRNKFSRTSKSWPPKTRGSNSAPPSWRTPSHAPPMLRSPPWPRVRRRGPPRLALHRATFRLRWR